LQATCFLGFAGPPSTIHVLIAEFEHMILDKQDALCRSQELDLWGEEFGSCEATSQEHIDDGLCRPE